MAGLRVLCSHAFRAAGRLTLAAAMAALGACSTLEELDPRGGLIPHTDQPVPGADQPYPNLASVPDAPPPTTPKATRIELQQKLAADTKATTFQPDTGAAPPIPEAPAPLPKGFITAEQPVRLPAAPAPAAAGAGATPAASPAPQESALAGAQPPAAQPATAAAAPAPGALGTARRLAVVLFAEGSSEIDLGQVAKLRPVVRLLRQQGGAVQIVGYASRQATGATAEGKIANFNLSLDRANAVARALMRLGVKPSELMVSAEGEGAPPITVAGVSGAAADQRADVYIAR
jgi:outer membrane protein OmpA-like peptidoglycan-associated protein